MVKFQVFSLRDEGIARELVNRIQNLRKDSGFEVTDKIEIIIENNDLIGNAINNNATYIKTETLATTLEVAEKVENGLDIQFDDVKTKLVIKKI